VNDDDDLMIINKSGIAIRLAVENLRVMGRATQGVKLINLKAKDSIAAVAKVIHEEEVEPDEDNSDSETEKSDSQNDEAPSTEDSSELNN
jgi:DNA gyrase subunit A